MIWVVLLAAWILVRGILYRRDVLQHGRRYARRRLLWSGVILLGIYGAILFMLLQLENRFIYYPQTERQYWQPPAGLKFEDVRLNSSAGDALHAWWCPQEGAELTILFNHGNAGNLSGHAWIIPNIRDQMKTNVFIYDYPGYGKSSGLPSESGCYAAAEAAYSWVTTTKAVPPEKLILMGQSLGSAMATKLASSHPHRAMVLLSPFTSVRDMAQELFPIFPTKWLMVHRYDNLDRIKQYQQPLLIGHATRDSIIPFKHGQRLFQACPSTNKVFHEMKEADHNDLDPGFFAALARFLQ